MYTDGSMSSEMKTGVDGALAVFKTVGLILKQCGAATSDTEWKYTTLSYRHWKNALSSNQRPNKLRVWVDNSAAVLALSESTSMRRVQHR
jgi:hypothetical protein